MPDNDRAWAFGGIVFGGAVTLSATSWAGAAAGALLTGEQAAPASPLTIYRMASDWNAVWTGSPTASAIGAVLLDVAVIALIVWGLRVTFRWFRNPSHLATPHQVRELTPKHAARTATRLRASLKDAGPKEIEARDRGVLLGDHLPSGVELRGSDEDTYVAIMAPRAGKSTSLAIPVAEGAPASLLMASNQADVYAATVASRARIGHTRVLDTQGVAQAEREMWWDMIAQAETLEGARRGTAADAPAAAPRTAGPAEETRDGTCGRSAAGPPTPPPARFNSGGNRLRGGLGSAGDGVHHGGCGSTGAVRAVGRDHITVAHA
ncbi:hypothetical protein [Streptomyces lavendofoliae]|nr:hypothetical protein [Streptomyces lavendofoliae]